MYVASELDKSSVQSEQRRLYERSRNNPDYVFCKLWGLVTDPRNLRMALARVARNKGARTAGVDGLNVRKALAAGVDTLGGLVLLSLGRMARTGDVVELGGRRVEVARMRGRRILRVTVDPPRATPEVLTTD